MFLHQRTIMKTVKVSGIGLHQGCRVSVTLNPARKDTGIIFIRTDLSPIETFELLADNVQHTPLCTVLKSSKSNAKLSITEHFMAALSSLGIDNIIVEVHGPELPILDGSSLPFILVINEAGIKDLKSSKKYLKVKEEIVVTDGDKWAKITPYNGFKVGFEIDFDHPVIRNTSQKLEMEINSQAFYRDLSRARTFGFMKDFEFLRERGLALGGSMSNAIVVDKFRIMNTDGLRYRDEFIRHKILDAVGDLYMSGNPLLGHFSAYKSGHELNNKLLRKLVDTKRAWDITPATNQSEEILPKN
jgi:UDP-3-O-[3-hydroxymyristoyl] N-acetylglucosamine deacetylase